MYKRQHLFRRRIGISVKPIRSAQQTAARAFRGALIRPVPSMVTRASAILRHPIHACTSAALRRCAIRIHARIWSELLDGIRTVHALLGGVVELGERYELEISLLGIGEVQTTRAQVGQAVVALVDGQDAAQDLDVYKRQGGSTAMPS